ncbi:hypothetical protein GR11A_00132 [Vibrio phage vB_VcorM_GR11A]|nr:hypothetical protein GR11A_00132 [Vibrio phage vB_VcorM_GR11A]
MEYLSPYKSYLVFSPPRTANGLALTMLGIPTEGIKLYHKQYLYYFYKGRFVQRPLALSKAKCKNLNYTFREAVVDGDKLKRMVSTRWSLTNNCLTVTLKVTDYNYRRLWVDDD